MQLQAKPPVSQKKSLLCNIPAAAGRYE